MQNFKFKNSNFKYLSFPPLWHYKLNLKFTNYSVLLKKTLHKFLKINFKQNKKSRIKKKKFLSTSKLFLKSIIATLELKYPELHKSSKNSFYIVSALHKHAHIKMLNNSQIVSTETKSLQNSQEKKKC